MALCKKYPLAFGFCVILIALARVIFLAEPVNEAKPSQVLSSSGKPQQRARSGPREARASLFSLQHEPSWRRDDAEERVRPEDLKTAQEVLVDVLRCKWAVDTERGIRKELDKALPANPTPLVSAAEEEKIKLLQGNLKKVTAVRKRCPDMPDEESDRDVYERLLAGARLGDKNAASCYIISSIEAPSLQADPDAFEEYNRNASDLIQKGMAAGDWNMVYLLEAGSGPRIGQSSWFSSLLVHDGLTTYKYKKLRRLGTVDDESHELAAC